MMAYEYETDEWRSSVNDLTEAERERNSDSRRAALGVTGDKEDDR